MSSIKESDIFNLIASKAQDFKILAENFARSRFLVAAMEYGDNEEEMLALNRIADKIKCDIVGSGSTISLSIDFDDGDTGNYLEVIERGMPAPVTGGAGGFVHNPDGSVVTSEVPPELWGNPIPEFAKSGSDTLAEVKAMLAELFASRVREIVSESTSEIASIVKNSILQDIRDALGS